MGGGILFVPTLVALGLSPHHAAATSLLAIVPTAAVGVWRQRRYGNLRAKAALLLGLPAAVGVLGGATLQQRLSGSSLTLAFSVLLGGIGIWLLAG